MPWNKDFCKKWVAALRSGKYTQGKGFLCTNAIGNPNEKRHCCLGVACELAGMKGKLSEPTKRAYTFGRTQQYLPKSVQKLIGCSTRNPTINGMALSKLNDNGTSFASIADEIEEYIAD
jgi:hypothetical protein